MTLTTKNQYAFLFFVYLFFVFFRFFLFLNLPAWFGDEFIYKSIASSMWNAGTSVKPDNSSVQNYLNVPNLLYPYVIQFAFFFKNDFYIIIRFINSIIINLALFPIFFIVKKYFNIKNSFKISAFCLTLAFLNIGAYAVTEVLYFPLFFLSIYFLLQSLELKKSSIYYSIVLGILLALLINTRIQGSIVLLSFTLCYISQYYKSANIQKKSLIFSYFFFITSFLISFIFIKKTLDPYGLWNLGTYAIILKEQSMGLKLNSNDILNLISGHLTTLFIPYSFCIAIFFRFIKGKNQQSLDSAELNFIICSLIIFLIFFVQTIAFTIGVSSFDLGGINRWHSRYYFYSYPLLIISSAIYLKKNKLKNLFFDFNVIYVLSIFFIAFIYFIFFFHATEMPWFASTVDNMDLQWFLLSKTVLFVFLLLLILLIIKNFIYREKYFFSFLIVWAIISNYGSLTKLGLFDQDKVEKGSINFSLNFNSRNSCSIQIFDYLKQNPVNFSVVALNYSELRDTLFWIPFLPRKSYILDNRNEDKIFDDEDFLVVVGNIEMPAKYILFRHFHKCNLYRLNKT
jgi:hypothetical protein